MTTIAARAGVMAADSRETDQHEALEFSFVVSDKAHKLHRLPDGSIFGGADGSESIHRLLESLKKKHACPKIENVSGLLVPPTGGLRLYEGNVWLKVKEPYYAIGTGASFAMAAMHAGADAITAVRIAARMDPFSGGRVRWMRARR
jgi:hypothetical protein